MRQRAAWVVVSTSRYQQVVLTVSRYNHVDLETPRSTYNCRAISALKACAGRWLTLS